MWLFAVVGLCAGAAIGWARTRALKAAAPALGAILGGLGGVAVAWSGYRPAWVLMVVMLLWLWIGFVDFAEQRIPDVLSGAAAATATVGLLGAAEVTGEWARFGQAAAIAVAIAAAAAVWSIFGTLGWGDVKLSASIGLMLGWQGWLATGAGIVAGILTAGIWAGIVAARRRSWHGHFPLAPSWLLGIFGVIVATHPGL